MNSILDQFGKRKNGRKDEPVMSSDNEAPPRFLLTPQAPHDRQQPARQSSTRSERYAQAAQQWEELENELRDAKAKYEIEINALRAERETQVHALQTEIHEYRGRLATVEKANAILNADCETLRMQGEVNRSRLDAQRAKLSIAAQIILDLANDEVRAPLTNEQSDAAHQAVEDALK